MTVPAIPLARARQIVVLAFLLVGVWYLNWRLQVFNDDHPVFSVLLYSAEVFGFCTALLNVFMTWRLSERVAPEAPAGLRVDVFVPTYNEDLDIVRRTALAARAMDYPHQTWILDDGNRPAMRELADTLGVRYLARTDNADAKAGNLNHALPHSDADLIATFDADHAPRRDFLTRTLGYFTDDRVAFVQTPQDFYNLDSYQNRTDPARRVAWSEQSLFFRVIQRGKDVWNSAFYCGSCAVIRRRALDDIAGFATGTVTEDLHTSLRLHKRGWRSVYHDEALAYGVAPARIEPFLKQRVRWGMGAMNVWRREGIVFTRGLTLAQRINYLATVLAYFDGWQKAFFYFAPVYVLAAGAMPIAADGWIFLLHFVPYYLLNFLAFEEISRGYGRSVLIEQYNMARFASFAWSTLAVFKLRRNFGVTAKKKSGATGTARFLLPHAFVIGLNGVAIPLGVVLFYQTGHLPADGMWANVVWASINALLAFSVVHFTRRRRADRRDEYRFVQPVAATLDGLLGTVDDLSVSGLSFYGPLIAAAPGKCVPLVLHLPDGALALEFEIRSCVRVPGDGPGEVRAVGGAFVDPAPAALARLEQFLFGSNAQWRVNQYREDSMTPLQQLGLVSVSPSEAPVRYWSACELVSADQPQIRLGMAGTIDPDARMVLMLHAPLDPTQRHALQVHSRVGQRCYRAQIGAHDSVPTGAGALHFYQLEVSRDATLAALFVPQKVNSAHFPEDAVCALPTVFPASTAQA